MNEQEALDLAQHLVNNLEEFAGGTFEHPSVYLWTMDKLFKVHALQVSDEKTWVVHLDHATFRSVFLSQDKYTTLLND